MCNREHDFARAACAIAALSLTLVAAACGGEQTSAGGADGASGSGSAAGNGGTSGESGVAGTAGNSPDDGAWGDDARFVIGTRVWDDTTTTSYFSVVSTLDAGTEVTLDQALEVPGPAKLYAIGDIGWFGIGGGEQPTIARYVLTAEGKLEEQQKISLQSYGVQSLWDTLYVVSETKMYYPDRDNGQLIVINPTEMVIDGVIELPDTSRPGFLSLYGYTPLSRDGKLLFTVGWFDWKETDSVLGQTGLVVLDTNTDTVESFAIDDRCGGITTGVVTGSGDAYFVSSALAGAAHRLGRLTTAPCALRVNAGQTAFDPGYVVALADVTSSSVSGEPVPGGDNTVYLRVFDEGKATISASSATWDLTGQAVWKWLRWDPTSGSSVPVDELAPSTSDVLWFEIDGRVFGTQSAEDYSRTTLVELTPEGPVTALTVPGFVHGVARVK